MNQLIIFILGLILGGVFVWFRLRRKTTEHFDILESVRMSGADKLQEFNKERVEEREANKQKILKLLEEKGDVTNNNVEELLSVSDATATRYLDELEKDGRIKQIGLTGHYVYYEEVI